MLSEKLTALYVKGDIFLDSLKKDQRGVTTIEYTMVLLVVATLILPVLSGDGAKSLKGILEKTMEEIASHLRGSP